MTAASSGTPPTHAILEGLLPEDRAERRLADAKPRLTAAEAQAEADRCLYCVDAPCTQACPTTIDVPGFIKRIASGNVRGAAKLIFDQNPLGVSCARVCPVEVLCAGSCVYGGWGREPIAIGKLQRFATETTLEAVHRGEARPLYTAERRPAAARRKVALVGAGPASLACAMVLAQHGHAATIFEKRSVPGGLNTTGIAPYKLHADDSLREVAWLLEHGEIMLETERKVGPGPGDISGASLLRDFDAVYIGVGLGEDSALRLPGEDGPGVVGATAWIEGMKLASATPATGGPLGRVVVVGGGNTAIDVARECARLGAEKVTMVYRRGAADMSGYAHEMEAARLDGVELVVNAVPVRFVRDERGALVALRVAHATDGKPDQGSHAREYDIPCSLAALAIGQSKLRDLAGQFPSVALDKRGCIVADPLTGATAHPKVYAGGDCINGGKEVVNAVADGRNTARHLIASWS